MPTGGANLDPRSDETLALQAQRGCRASFTQLVERYDRRVLRFLLQRAPRHDAEDAMQEAFIKAWSNLGRYNPRWRFSTWLFTIASRELTTLQRRQRRHRPLADAEGVAISAQPPALEGAPGPWAVAQRLLADEHYCALWLCYGEGMGAREIARVLGRSSVWVRVSLFRSRRALRAAIKSQEQGVKMIPTNLASAGAAGGAV